MSSKSNTPPTDHHKIETNTIQTFCSCGKEFLYLSDFEAHIATPTDTSLDEILDKYYAPIKLPDNNREGLKQAILTHYIKKSDVLDIVMGAIPKDYPRKVGLNFAQLWDSADATDGYNQALRDVEQALTTALKERL